MILNFRCPLENWLRPLLGSLILFVLQWLVRWVWWFTFAGSNFHWGSECFSALILGTRLDLTVAAYGALLLFVTSGFGAMPLRYFRVLFGLLVFVILFVQALDLGYYSFFKERLNPFVFDFFVDDTWAVTVSVVKNYPVWWILASLLILTLFALWSLLFLEQKVERWVSAKIVGQKTQVLGHIAIFISLGLLARGSLGLFPLSDVHAHLAGDPFLTTWAQNSVRRLARSVELFLKMKNPQAYHSLKFKDAPKAWELWMPQETPFKPNFQQTNQPVFEKSEGPLPHILVLLLESLSSEYLEALSKWGIPGKWHSIMHIPKGRWFWNVTPPGQGTIGAISSLLAGLTHPEGWAAWTESRFRSCRFSTRWPHALANLGYSFNFVYGGNLGWRDIDHFASRQGFALHGEEDIIKSITKRNRATHPWGVHDEYVFQYISSLLQKDSDTPKLIVALTTTNHPPFEIPDDYSPPPLSWPKSLNLLVKPEVGLSRLQTFVYQLDQFSEFLEKLSASTKRPVWVLALGDHSFQIFQENVGQFPNQVPLFMYHSQKSNWWEGLLVSEKEPIFFDDIVALTYDLIPTHIDFVQPVGRSLRHSIPSPDTKHSAAREALKEFYLLPHLENLGVHCEF